MTACIVQCNEVRKAKELGNTVFIASPAIGNKPLQFTHRESEAHIFKDLSIAKVHRDDALEFARSANIIKVM